MLTNSPVTPTKDIIRDFFLLGGYGDVVLEYSNKNQVTPHVFVIYDLRQSRGGLERDPIKVESFIFNNENK